MNERGGVEHIRDVSSQKRFENLCLKVDCHAVDPDPELLPWADQ
jgi:hypothetical protein